MRFARPVSDRLLGLTACRFLYLINFCHRNMGCWTTLNLVNPKCAKSARKAVNAGWHRPRNANLRTFLTNVRLGPGCGLEINGCGGGE